MLRAAKGAGVRGEAKEGRMDALALVECQRITAVLESGVEKLGILASLTTDLHNEVRCGVSRLGGGRNSPGILGSADILRIYERGALQ